MCVSTIYQDRQGYLWFGTKDGLNRYDGYQFKIYRHIPFDLASLSSSRITAICEDYEGRMWVGTFEKGLNVLDPDSGSFHHLEHQPGNPGGLSGNSIRDIAVTPDGSIWVATSDSGLNRVTVRPGTPIEPGKIGLSWEMGVSVTQFRHSSLDAASLSSDSVNRLLVDRQGRLWIGTNTGLDSLDPRPDRLGRDQSRNPPAAGSTADNPDTAIFSHWPLANSDPARQGVNTIFEDSHGALWLGTVDGLCRLDPQHRVLNRYPQMVQRDRPGLSTIKSICESPLDDATNAGKLWLGTYGGLVIFDMASASFSYPGNDPDRPGQLGSGSILDICRDRGGVVWLSSNGDGVYKYDSLAVRFDYPDYVTAGGPGGRLSSRRLSIRAIAEDSGNRGNILWLGANGLFEVDRRQGRLRKLNLRAPGGRDPGIVYSILQDRQGVVWVGAGQGLFSYHSRNASFEHYSAGFPMPGGGVDPRIFKVIEAADGAIWVLTARSFGRFDRRTGQVRHYRYDSTPPNSFEDPVFSTAYQDEEGYFWLGTPTGLLRFDPRQESFLHYRYNPDDLTSLSFDVVLSLAPDFREPQHLLWLGTAGGGLNRFDRRTGAFTHYTEANGLPSNYIYGILTDRVGNLWLSTNNGLCRFDPLSGKINNYDARDQLQGNEFNAGAFFESDSGEMFFGGISGFNQFYPESIGDNNYVPPIAITECQINNKPVPLGPATDIRRQNGAPAKEISLSYTDLTIMFSFTALNFSNSERNRYAYRLTGFQDDWVPLGKRRTITFTHLDPGEYLFHVKGSNNDGVWNETGTSVRITIQPPFWRTWWAYTLILAMVLAVMFGFRRYELNRLRLKYNLGLLENEMRLASQIQLDLLPRVPPQVEGYDIAGKSSPSHWVGGDYFDFIPIADHCLALCLGDVSGKGLPAALLMANLQAITRSQTQPGVCCREAVGRSNNLLAHNTDWGKFATLFHAILDSSTHQLHFCCAGHNHPILLSVGSPPRRLQTGGLVLGFAQDSVYEEEIIDLRPGDTMVVFSDGISEARNAADEEFGEDRLLKIAENNQDLSAAELIDVLFTAVRNYTTDLPQADDMTLIVIKRCNPSEPDPESTWVTAKVQSAG